MQPFATGKSAPAFRISECEQRCRLWRRSEASPLWPARNGVRPYPQSDGQHCPAIFRDSWWLNLLLVERVAPKLLCFSPLVLRLRQVSPVHIAAPARELAVADVVVIVFEV